MKSIDGYHSPYDSTLPRYCGSEWGDLHLATSLRLLGFVIISGGKMSSSIVSTIQNTLLSTTKVPGMYTSKDVSDILFQMFRTTHF